MILLDVQMPGMDGFETAATDQAARADARHPDHLPDRDLEGGAARLPGLRGRRRRLRLQAVRPRHPAVEGRRLHRPLGEDARSCAGTSEQLREQQARRARAARARSATARSPTRCRRSSGRPTPTGSATYYNRRWFEYTGMRPDEADAERVDARRPPRRPAAMPSRGAAVRSRPASVFEAEYRFRAARRQLPLAPRAGRCRCSATDGEIEFWVGTATDIHDRKRIEDAQRFLARRRRGARELARLPHDARERRAARRARGRRLVRGARRRGRRLDPQLEVAHVDPSKIAVRARAAGALPGGRRQPDGRARP